MFNTLLTFQNTKFLKTSNTDWFIVGLSLAPHKLGDGKTNLCKFSTPSCRMSCIFSSGHGGSSKVEEARKRKTLMFLNNREEFLIQLSTEIFYFEQLCKNNNKKLAVRLNTFSDIDWFNEKIEGFNLFDLHKSVQYYDYTKDYNKISTNLNYHLTYSYDQINHNKGLEVLKRGDNLAVVFEKKLPKTFFGYKVIDGNTSDLRFLDEKNVVVGLSYKNLTYKGVDNITLKKESTLVIKRNSDLNKIKNLNIIYD